ncbi:MAG TPA: hypothetical protein VNR62_08945, partial [Cellulomonas sp.]|nr:hypothetical protein [Cellulomonas sp.]
TATPTPTPTPTPTAPVTFADLYLDPSGALTTAVPAPGRIEIARSSGLGDNLQEPADARVFELRDVDATPTGGATAFDVAVDAGVTVGSGTQLSVAYDLTGDGTWDRTEVYRYFATDPVPGDEHYTQAVGLVRDEGTLGALRGGTIRVAIWNAIGSQPTTVDAHTSVLDLPLTR